MEICRAQDVAYSRISMVAITIDSILDVVLYTICYNKGNFGLTAPDAFLDKLEFAWYTNVCLMYVLYIFNDIRF